MSFTHLQVHSGYSIMNSTITVERLAEQVKKLGMDSVALTDDHVLYGAVQFYKACLKTGIKPIIGMTINVKESTGSISECILLAKNNHGYKNLMQISTLINLTDIKSMETSALAPHVSGLICILPATNKHLSDLLQNLTHDEVNDYLESEWGMFAFDDFYIGVQDHGLERDRKVNTSLQVFHKGYGIQVTAVNNVWYLDEKDSVAFDCLQAMKNGKGWMLRNPEPEIQQHHLRSESEMMQVFADWPNVLKTTAEIKKKCNVSFDFEHKTLPAYPVPAHQDAHTYLTDICRGNLHKKYNVVTDEIENRLTYELKIIKSMGFSDYFLIVWDFIAYAKEQHIMVGPGRGSAAGSLVAYVLGITEVDPIQYELLFERFLNPERITMPDIDVDFSDHRRDEVIAYVREKYGDANVAQIITFGTFAARSLIRELIKTMGIEQQEAHYLLKDIPSQSRKSIVELVKDSRELQEYVQQSRKLKALLKVAAKLEGLPRHISTHAAGVVISDKPLVGDVPLTEGAAETNLTQFSMNDLESIGLLKMDFLGLRNLTLLERILKTIAYQMKKTIGLQDIPDNDEAAYNLLQEGKTNGIFQLESQGMKRVLRNLEPTRFEDIVAVNALYRPGPMEHIPEYIERKHGNAAVTYPHPDLESILGKTYGVLVYQEQIMQIANKLAGFTLGEADILRRAVSKKQQQMMDELKEKFIVGCSDKGYSVQVAEEIFQWIVKFSNYGFNRSHAVAYSKISYQLAYLKAHYPRAFFAELLSSAGNQQDKLHLYMTELREMGIQLLPPSINKSFGKYSVEAEGIRMGLLSIKGIGNNVVKELIRARKDGPFKSLFDLCLRVSLKTVNRSALETIIMAGAFDQIYNNRASLLASIDRALEQGELFKEFTDQSSLFQDGLDLEGSYIEMEDFSQMKKLTDEKGLLGIYISSHPLKKFREILSMNNYVSMKEAQQMIGRKNIKSAGIIQSIKVIRTKRGESMAFVTVGDETGEMEGVIFPDVYREVNPWLSEEKIITLSGKIEARNNKIQWLMSNLDVFQKEAWEPDQTRRLFIKLTGQDSEKAFKVIKHIASKYRGNIPIIVYNPQSKQTYKLSMAYSIQSTDGCLRLFRNHFGNENVVLNEVHREVQEE
ncbi:DNA polymerase III subunit alpha [Virgibacillus siamensis]|uniref:DNA polymerase III subunit alpha n=1 Tax=Virgibacillus siamensis TaxID=480071 RepID=UPI0009856BE9|nr:DNA polymerase III subunit alpha [Virgibacillus siamensis]